MNQIIKYFIIIRPLNVVLSGITVLIASYLLSQINNYMTIIIALIVMLSCAAANIINDLLDIKTNRINAPTRPIIIEDNIYFTNKIIIMLVGIISIVIILSIIYLHYYAKIFFFTIILLIMIYTPILKRIPLIGNITISFIISSVFIFSEITFTYKINILCWPALLTFLLTLIREIIKDIADIEGDKISGINTFPVIFGITITKYIILKLIIFLIIISIYPYLINFYNINYLILLILCIHIPLIGCIFYLWKHPNSKGSKTLTIITKYITIGGMVVILSTKLLA